MNEKLKRRISTSNTFINNIETLVVAKGGFPNSSRNSLLLAYWSLVFEFDRGIFCLLSNNFPGAAFALVRPVVEAVVRAHVAIMGTDEEVDKLSKDEYRTNLATIGKEIDSYFRTENLFENFLASARLPLHSYTHSGLAQTGRRFNGTDLVPNYSENETAEVIRVAASAAFIVNNLVTKFLGLDDEWTTATDLYVAWAADYAAN
jgi:hypothetical protein